MQSLEILDKNNQFAYRLQSDQINDLNQKLNESEMMHYDRGFREGESHALLKYIKGDSLYDYADGYHAALFQFANDNKTNIDKETYSLFLDLLDMLEESDRDYNDLLDFISDEK